MHSPLAVTFAITALVVAAVVLGWIGSRYEQMRPGFGKTVVGVFFRLDPAYQLPARDNRTRVSACPNEDSPSRNR